VNTPDPCELGPDTSAPDNELAALRTIVEGTARGTGQAFFDSLVMHLAKALGTKYAFVAEFSGAQRVRSLAHWGVDRIIENEEWDLAGTPCEEVVRGNLCHHPSGVCDKFPTDDAVVQLGIQSYLGVPLCDASGSHLGHLAVYDDAPLPPEPKKLFTFRIFAARAATELERLRAENQLAESERRFRDLYEEAPNAYITADAAGKLTGVNRRAAEMLGLPIAGLMGTSLEAHGADTPAGQPVLREAHRAALSGQSTDGIEIELRRADGTPVWVSAWFKPLAGSGGQAQGSRSIWADITDRVLAEQEKGRLQQQNLYLLEEIKATHNFEEIVGQSAALRAVLDNLTRVAATDATVLITGETGTGKELIARAIHSRSRRKEKPFIKINCAALPAGLVESELFGHEKGAFTGAIARRLGRFELANGGTIFLDEIGEVPIESQAKLLRAIQEREFERVGGTSSIRVDVRLLAATNRDLLKSAREKTFREDLYYRLSVFPIKLPPLRERGEDIPALVHFLVNKFAMQVGRKVESVQMETMRRLSAYPWPGNIRELENVLERAVILADGPVLEVPADVLGMTADAPVRATPCTLEDVEKEHIRQVLRQANGVIDGANGAAKVLGLHPNTLRSRMKKLGIQRSAHEGS
jgi:PAS domain S-box-containing protein